MAVKNSNGQSSFENMGYYQKLAFLSSGTSNVNVFNGLSVEGGTADRVKFVRKPHKLFRFIDGYLPFETKPAAAFDFESALTFSEEGHAMQTKGVNSSTISMAKPWASARDSFENAKTTVASPKKVLSYLTERRLCNTVDLSINPDQIVPDYEFVQKLKAAFAGKDSGVDKYQALVEVLNEWGWYVPLQFTLGSAIYATKRGETDTYETAVATSAKFDVNFKAAFAGTGQQDEEIVFYEFDGSIIRKDDFPKWADSLKDPEAWYIISYAKLLPTLLLLNDKEDETLSEALTVLRENYTNKFVKDLQKYIEVGKYEYEVSKIVAPTYE